MIKLNKTKNSILVAFLFGLSLNCVAFINENIPEKERKAQEEMIKRQRAVAEGKYNPKFIKQEKEQRRQERNAALKILEQEAPLKSPIYAKRIKHSKSLTVTQKDDGGNIVVKSSTIIDSDKKKSSSALKILFEILIAIFVALSLKYIIHAFF